MSVVDRMEVRGIRSYSPHHSVQMEFPVPVTIIVGHNGSGKTTLIECLKFACTGETPTGNKSAFVHAPKLAEESEVRGQVKLQFTDTQGKVACVSRTLQTVQKQKSCTTKTLDGTIRRVGRDGKTETISKKCADLDKEMIRALGVSKSVLNSVIFCHQEDSMWPLAEGSVVKKRFDEIFGQNRDVKCVEQLKKKCKDLKQSEKINQVDLGHLLNNKDRKMEVSEDLERSERKLGTGEQEIIQTDLKLIELKKQYSKSQELLNEATQCEKKRDEYATRLDAVSRSRKQLEDKIETVYPHKTEKLQSMLASFELQIQEKRKKEYQTQKQLVNVVECYDKASEHQQNLNMELGRLKEAQKSYRALEERSGSALRELVSDVQKNSEVLGQGELQVPESYKIQWIENTLEEAQHTHNNTVKKNREEQTKQQRKIDDMMRKTAQVEEEIKIKKENRKKLKEEMDKLQVEIHQLKSSAVTLARIEQEKKDADEDYTKFLSENRIDEMTRKAEFKQKEMRQASDQLSELTGELEILQLESEARQDRERTERELSAKKLDIDSLIKKNESGLMFCFGSMPADTQYSARLTRYLKEKSDEVKKQSVVVNKEQRQLTQRESELMMAEKQLKHYEQKARELKNEIVKVCANPAIYESEVDRAENDYKQAKKSVSASDGFQYLYGRWRSKIQSSHKCPICKSGLDHNKTKEVLADMTQKIDAAPDDLIERKRVEKASEERFFALKAASALYKQLNDLEQNMIPEQSRKVTTLTEQVEVSRDLLLDAQDAIDSLAAQESEARCMERDCDRIDRLQSESKKHETLIRDLSSRIVSSYTKTLKQAIEEQGTLQKMFDSVSHEYNRLVSSKTHCENKRNALQANCNNLKQQYLDLSVKLQGLRGMEERRKEKAIAVQESARQERGAEEGLLPAQDELKAHTEQLTAMRLSHDQYQKEVQNLVSKLTNDTSNVRKLELQLQHQRGAAGGDLEMLSDQMTQSEEETVALKEQRKHLERSLQVLQKELDSSQVQKRDLEDCVDLRVKEQEEEDIRENLRAVEEEMRSGDLAVARRAALKVQGQLDSLARTKAEQEGRNKGFKEEIERFKRELNSDMLKDAELKCFHQEIECKVTELACKDLELYIKAYERAIMRFHSNKMQEINKTLRDLWASIYRGGDIDYIEIRSDEDDADSATNKRRVCNYRVVMVKGGTHVDMRAHSSAGQRVLASLLIRLALAETFCDQCGIIALDEPTTNLDRDNIESLAHALSTFIRLRQGCSNFQLIIITHDEDFVELLGRSEYIDYYYKVEKDANMHSTVTKRSVTGLATGHPEH